ncbi:MAG: hypothetical protein K6G62_04930 [Eubacterium sp.]|nr:hypothetical protein [Eubacterium sp.]
MSTIIHLSNQKVQVVVGNSGSKKITVQKCFSDTAPEGSIINGMITDPEAFIEFMKEFWSRKKLPTKDVYLLINSTKFIGKKIEAPAMNAKKMLDYAAREFAELDASDNAINGYIPLSGSTGKMKHYYAECVDADFLQEHIDIFREIGIPLKGIYSGESSLIGLTDRTVGRDHKTFVLEIAEENNITTLLWVDGGFYYFNSIRCFNEKGSPEYCQDVARSVSQINQFMRANQIESELECVMMAGVEGEELESYITAIRDQGFGLPVVHFKSKDIVYTEGKTQGYLYASAGLMQVGGQQNFLQTFTRSGKRRTESKGKPVKVIAVASVLAVMLAILGITLFIKSGKQKELDMLVEYNESAAVVSQTEEYDQYSDRNSFLTAQYNAIKDIDENIYSYPICNDKVLKEFKICAKGFVKIQFEAFNADDGVAEIRTTAKTVKAINRFIARLNQRDIFSDVNYTGYTYDDDEKVWDVHVICTLSEAAGRKGEKK